MHIYFQFRLFLMALQCFGSPSCSSFIHRRPLRSSTFSAHITTSTVLATTVAGLKGFAHLGKSNTFG
jgi:hypothetical protein